MNNLTPKPVLKYDHDGVFRKKYKSEFEACKKLDIDPGNLCRALHKGICAGGFYWRYDNGEDPKIKIPITRKLGKRIKVYKKKLYLCTCCSIAEVSELLKLPASVIRKHIKSGDLTEEGFKFEEDKGEI